MTDYNVIWKMSYPLSHNVDKKRKKKKEKKRNNRSNHSRSAANDK